MIHRAALVSCAAFIAVFQVGSASGQGDEAEVDEELDREPLRCVPMGQIQSSVVANDRSVLFYRSGVRIYLNILEQQCRGLQRNGLFSYRIRGGIRVARLCDSDAITVIDKLTNSAGATCRLSVFHPVSEAQADDILNFGRMPGGIEITPVELPPAEGAAADGDAAEATEAAR